MSMPKRYHPLLVGLHWLIALLVIFMLGVGKFFLSSLPNDAAKVMPLGMHMVSGIVIGTLMLVRLVVRYKTPKPEKATTGNALLDAIGVMTHGLLYVLVFAMAFSGMGISQSAGLPGVVFGGQGSLPQDFFTIPARLGHGLVSTLLLLLVLLHVGAALYHQFIKKDNLLARMWFGPR